VLLIVTFRPEFEPPWIGRPYVTPLTINRLAEREVGAMIDGVIGNKLLPANIRQDIIERTDGIPLFVEEMTRAVLEAKDEEAAERTVAAVPSPSIAVPPSLHASLMARLDRLGAAKEIAQIGAGDRTRVQSRSAGRCSAQARAGVGASFGSDRSGWLAVSSGRTSSCELSL
jgi:predicted ATPase